MSWYERRCVEARTGLPTIDVPLRIDKTADSSEPYEVLTTYCRPLDRCDVELMKTVYWEDGRHDQDVFTGNAQEFAEFIVNGVREWFEVGYHAI